MSVLCRSVAIALLLAGALLSAGPFAGWAAEQPAVGCDALEEETSTTLVEEALDGFRGLPVVADRGGRLRAVVRQVEGPPERRQK